MESTKEDEKTILEKLCATCGHNGKSGKMVEFKLPDMCLSDCELCKVLVHFCCRVIAEASGESSVSPVTHPKAP